MQKALRPGFTTGACAAAGAKAAILAWRGEFPAAVEVRSPQGQAIRVPIFKAERRPDGGAATVVKDGGDDPDITHGASIVTTVALGDGAFFTLRAGEGVGTVTKPGLSAAVGEPAINPGPRRMIRTAVQEVLPPGHGCTVTVAVPGGAALAARTLNPSLGIEGGLSIIGTTGVVRPMSEEAFKDSLTPQIQVAKALGYADIVFAPGKIGQDIAINRYGLPADAVVQTSNFVGHMLEAAVQAGVRRVLLFGHIGKLVKVAAGIFHTHNRLADARLETLAAYLGAAGAPPGALREILACATTEAALPIVARCGLESVYATLAARASLRAERYVFGDLTVGTVIVTLKGDLLGRDAAAAEIGAGLGWSIK